MFASTRCDVKLTGADGTNRLPCEQLINKLHVISLLIRPGYDSKVNGNRAQSCPAKAGHLFVQGPTMSTSPATESTATAPAKARRDKASGGSVDEALSTFLSVRSRLFGVAYRILGSAADAEDVVQSAWLKWQMKDRSVRR